MQQGMPTPMAAQPSGDARGGLHEIRARNARFSWYLGRVISRDLLSSRILAALKRARVVALVGPRQSGKTTLARALVHPDNASYFDLENPTSLARLAEPMTALAPLRGVVVIDEVQRRPDLFSVLRVLADRNLLRSRFLVLGSASPALLRQTSESLAGRIEVIEIPGFALVEVGDRHLERHWRRGGFPLSFTARSEAASAAWRRQFVATFVERDLPQLGLNVPAESMRRFWSMLAHSHGQIWNAADPARSLGVAETTVRRYLDLLSGAFMVRQLRPWHENLAKRQVKAPKVYFRDSGLLHAMLGIHDHDGLLRHPKGGASWEGYAIEEALKAIRPDDAYFWATHQGAELDLLLFKGGRRLGIEAKRADAPTLSKSMRIAFDDLKLDRLAVLYPGSQRYPIGPNAEAIPLRALAGGAAEVFPPRGR